MLGYKRESHFNELRAGKIRNADEIVDRFNALVDELNHNHRKMEHEFTNLERYSGGAAQQTVTLIKDAVASASSGGLALSGSNPTMAWWASNTRIAGSTLRYNEGTNKYSIGLTAAGWAIDNLAWNGVDVIGFFRVRNNTNGIGVSANANVDTPNQWMIGFGFNLHATADSSGNYQICGDGSNISRGAGIFYHAYQSDSTLRGTIRFFQVPASGSATRNVTYSTLSSSYETLRIYEGGTVIMGSPAAYEAPVVSAAKLMIMVAGGSYMIARDCTNNVEALIGCDTSGAIVGAMTGHALVLRTNNVTRVDINAASAVMRIDTAAADTPTVAGKLQVYTAGASYVTVRNATNDIETIIGDNATNSLVGSSTAHALSLITSNTARMDIAAASAVVRINVAAADTPTVAGQLQVYTAGAAYVTVRNSTADIETIVGQDTTNSIIGASTNHLLQIRTNNTTRMTVAAAAAEVGIGVTPASGSSLALASALLTTYGGTGLTSWTAGDLPYYATGTLLSKLAIGASTTFLTSSGTAPQWSPLVATILPAIGAITSEPTGFPHTNSTTPNSASTITFTAATRKFTIAPSSGSFTYYIKGTAYTISTTKEITITNAEDDHYIYLDTDSALHETQTWNYNLMSDYCLVAEVHWSVDQAQQIYMSDERHGISMPWEVQKRIHATGGAILEADGGLAPTGFTADGTGNDAVNCQIGWTGGAMWDDDLRHAIAADTVPTQIPILYKFGASGLWRKASETDYAVIFTGSTTDYAGTGMAYNLNTAGTWSLATVGNNQFGLMHYFATSDPDQPIIAICGQATYATLALARAAAPDALSSLISAGIPVLEFKSLWTFIFQYSSSYGNAPKTRIRSLDSTSNYFDHRYESGGGGGIGGVATDHGTLSGLADDDHLQYLLLATTRGSQTIASSVLLTGTVTSTPAAGADLVGYSVTGLAGTASNKGLNVDAISAAASGTNYGIYIGAVSGASTNNYAVYAAGGESYFAGTTTFGASLYVTNNIVTYQTAYITDTNAAGWLIISTGETTNYFDTGVIFQHGSVSRWAAYKTGDSTADLYIARYNDAGTYQGAPIQIARATGVITTESGITAGGNVSSKDAFKITNGTYTFTFTPAAFTADRAIAIPNVAGTIITTGNLTDITAVGTIASGTWQGTAIASTYIGAHNQAASTITSGTFASTSGYVISGGTSALIQLSTSSSTSGYFAMNVVGDVGNRFQILGSGYMDWATGEAAADTNLYRADANVLKTDDSFVVGAALTVTTTAIVGAATALTGALGAGAAEIYKASNGTLLLSRTSADTGGPTLEFLKRRSAWGVVNNGDRVGTIGFSAADSVDAANGAQIYAEVSAAPASNDMPMDIVFATSPDGSATVAEAMRITQAKDVKLQSTLTLKEISTPSDPASGYGLMYVDTAGFLHYVSDAGVDTYIHGVRYTIYSDHTVATSAAGNAAAAFVEYSQSNDTPTVKVRTTYYHRTGNMVLRVACLLKGDADNYGWATARLTVEGLSAADTDYNNTSSYVAKTAAVAVSGLTDGNIYYVTVSLYDAFASGATVYMKQVTLDVERYV